MVSGLTSQYKMAEPRAHSRAENSSAWRSLSWPLAVGRQAVRFILASMDFSTKQLNAAAAAATSQMPTQPQKPCTHWADVGMPGTARTMPISAQNTMSCTTRGLVSAWYWRQTDRRAGVETEFMQQTLRIQSGCGS